jgi:hypothetical protein
VGSLAYIATGGVGLEIIDVSNAAAPRIVATVSTPGSASGVAVANGFAYVADSTALWVVDVRTPTQARIVGSLATAATAVATGPNATLDVVAGPTLQIVDIRTASRPTIVGATSSFGAQAVAALGTTVLLANGGSVGLNVVNASAPSSPVFVTRLYNGFYASGVGASGALAVATGQGWGMRVLDVSNPLAPTVVGTLSGDLRKVAMSGNIAYVANLVPGNPPSTLLVAVDLSDPRQPTMRGRVNFGTSLIQDIKIVGTLAYVITSAGLQTIDISNPANLLPLGSFTTPTSATAVAVVGRYAYVGTTATLFVVDVSAPRSPVLAGSSPAATNALAAGNGVLYALQSGVLNIYGLSVPTQPTLLGSVNGQAAGLDVLGQVVVLARRVLHHYDTPGTGVVVVDVSVPSQPQIVQEIVVPGTTCSITVNNGLVYTGDSASTVDILELGPAGSMGVTGQVYYYSKPSLPVNAVTVQLQNGTSGSAVSQTDTTGRFSFSGIGTGNWQLAPRKTGDFGSAIDVADAVVILQSTVGKTNLTSAQQLACDVSGDGTVNITDAVLILQYTVGLTTRFPVAQQCGSEWAFVPAPAPATNQTVLPPQITSGACRNGAIAFSPLASSVSNQNFSAVLFGDCSGNWQPTVRAPALALTTNLSGSVGLGHPTRRQGNRIRVPLLVQSPQGMRALSVQVGYDPGQLTALGVQTVGNARQALVQSNPWVPGSLKIALAGGSPLPDGVVLMLDFAAKRRFQGRPAIYIQHAVVR